MMMWLFATAQDEASVSWLGQLFDQYFTRPITDEVTIYALAMIILLVAPIVMARLKMPSIVGLILAGALVGPKMGNLLVRDTTIILLGTVGLLYLMFLAGLEIDLNEFKKSRKKSLTFGAISYLLPQLVGLGVGYYLGAQLGLNEGSLFLAALLFGSVFGSHTLLAYPITGKLKINKAESVVVVVGGSIVTDLSALLVLAVVVGASAGQIDLTFWLTLGFKLSLFAVVVLIVLPRFGRWFFSKTSPEAQGQFVFVIAMLFLSAFLAKRAGVEPIVGAFLSGLGFNSLIPHQGTLMNRIKFVGDAVFIPFFLISVGMLVDMPMIVSSPQVWLIAGVMCSVVLLMKTSAAKISQNIFGLSPAEGWMMSGLSSPQAAATLATVIIGANNGLFNDATVNGAIAMILVTCVIGPLTVEHFGKRVAEELRSAGPAGTGPQRILVPISQADQIQSLMEVALLLRTDGNTEPIYPVSVLRDDVEDIEAAVTLAERMLDETVHVGASVDVQVSPSARLAQRAAAGVLRAAVERRITDVIVQWNGQRESGQVLGPTLDELLVELRQQVLACHIKHALNATNRVVLALPPGMLGQVGFNRAGETVKKLCQQCGALLTVLAMSADEEAYRSRLESLKPDVGTTVIGFSEWSDLLGALGEKVDEDDLVVVMSPRPGSAQWSEALAELPGRLPELVHRSFMLLFPATHVAEEENAEVRSIDEAMTADRVLLDVGEPDVYAALRALAFRDLDQMGVSVEAAQRVLFGEGEPSWTGRQQALVVDGKMQGIESQRIYVARRIRGMDWPDGGSARPRLLCVVLSPTTVADEAHERLKQEVMRVLEGEEMLYDLLRVDSERGFIERIFRTDEG